MEIEKIVRALRCSATRGAKDCEDCPYSVLYEVNPDLPFQPVLEIDGVEYWKGCDVCRIVMDAAEALEVLAILESD